MNHLTEYIPNSGQFISIDIVDGIPLTSEQAAIIDPIVRTSMNTSDYYISGGELKSNEGETNQITFKTVDSDGVSIINLGDSSLLMLGNVVWMTNSHSSMNQLYSQYYDAVGDVVIGGLGMGITSLLVANKASVNSVTVIESDPRVIDVFMAQGFDLTNITIIQGDIYTHEGTYDVALFDHYNHGDVVIDDICDYFILTAGIKNFYTWELECPTYADYKSRTWTTPRTLHMYSKFVATYSQGGPIKEIVNAIADINGDVEVPVGFSLNVIQEKFVGVNKIIRGQFHNLIDDGSVFLNDYCIYREGDVDILAYGVTWTFGSKKYSAKYQEGTISDLYEIYPDARSAEIDMTTLEVLFIYEDTGSDKTSPEGVVVQANHKVKSTTDMPLALRESLSASRFPYVGNVFYWADKPYGRVVEFSHRLF